MSSSSEKAVGEIQQEETVKKQGIIKTHLLDWKHSIIRKPDRPVNIWHLLTNLNNKQRITFTAAFLGWMLDAFDFFSVSLTTTYIAEEFNVPVSDVTSAITTTLTFIGLRAVFGICMGGEWGLGASLALETLPIEARGLFSGIFQEGYACGYLLATLINYAIQSRGGSWRILFWVGAAFALLAVVIRFWVPESEAFKETKKARKMLNRSVWKEGYLAVKKHWLRLIYMVIFAAFFNFFSHGSQDLYPTFLMNQLGYTETEKTVTSVIYNIGAIVGGILFGYLSNYLGRRFVVVICAIGAGAFIALWAFGPSIASLQFGSFMMQFFVQGGWGVVPAYLNEISPPGFRGLLPGLAYQLGNLISAASSQIEASIGERYPLQNPDGSLKLNAKGQPIPNYALTQAIFMGCVCAGLLITVFFGKEETNKDFMQHLVEDEHSPNTVGVAEIQDSQMEHGESGSGDQEKEIVQEQVEHPDEIVAHGDGDKKT
ncbi:hypothetical protein [Absidia glauca]|uniref:Major facilitator superfamily (MFS) profile domain-containing protein n=1 Tax=Absidia glauca TaxID=4829 RepID=A0A163J5F1_ABSGL|nr:hypothetical protein [Absidia glauca]